MLFPQLYARPDHLDAAFDEVDAASAEQDLARLVAEWDAARRAIEDLPLDHVFVSDRWGPMQLRCYCISPVSTTGTTATRTSCANGSTAPPAPDLILHRIS